MNIKWASPQRMEGKAVTAPDDVYSYGCMVYYVSHTCCAFDTKLTVYSCIVAYFRFTVSATQLPC
jgi:hypothetical protein